MNWASIWFRSWSTSSQKLTLRARLHQRHQHFMKAATIAQEKNGQDRHQKQHPHLLCRLGCAKGDALRQSG